MLSSATWGKYGGGSGTAEDPYQIYNAEHLKAIAQDQANWGYYVQYELMADIDMVTLDGPMPPIGSQQQPFSGIFDGNGKTISNLKIAAASGDFVGLFGYGDFHVYDLGLINVAIDAPNSTSVGALAGRAVRQIERCYVSGGTVTGRNEVGGLIGTGLAYVMQQCYTACKVSGNEKVGGLIGSHEAFPAERCYSASIVSGTMQVGGLVGLNRGILKDCYATGEVHGSWIVGGLVGMGLEEGHIWNCYAAGRVSAESSAGGLCGGGVVSYSSFWDMDAGGQTASALGVGKTTAQMRAAATFLGWGRSGAWTIEEGVDYPRLAWQKKPGTPLATPAFRDNEGDGTAKKPYLIHTVEELNAIGDFPGEWDRQYRLESDLDMAALQESFRLLGREDLPFTGTFDGNRHTISNFKCPYASYGVGLFGQTNGATIRRLILINPCTEAEWAISVGTLIGQQVKGTVEACAAEDGFVAGGLYVGGLIGRCCSGTVTQCYSTCAVEGRQTAEDIGGLVGRGERCNINNCYAKGSVSGLHYVGGLIGRTMDAGSVTQCYSTGYVNCPQNIWFPLDAGGLIGTVDRTFVAACFWDTQTSGFVSSAAGRGLVTADLQKAATFIQAGWDLWGETKNGTSDFWSVEEGKDYPRLFQQPPAPVIRAWADDFEDGEPAPLWRAHTPTSNAVRIVETNGRLQVSAADNADGDRAMYVATGWALDGSMDFSIKIEFRFDANEAGEAWVSLWLTPTPDNPTGQYVDITAGNVDHQPNYAGRQSTIAGRQRWWAARGCDSGTLYISYNAETDELYRSFTGFGPVNAWHVATGLVKEDWAGKPLYVVIGGGSTGMRLKDGEAWLDNFSLDTGEVVQ